MKRLAELSRLLWALASFLLTAGELYDIFDPCCLEGVKWSSDSYRCDNYPGPVANISDSDQAACLSIIEICCIKQTQMVTCERGKQTAMTGDICAIRDMEPGAEQFRECCHCCQLGLVSRDFTGLGSRECRAPNLGEPCDTKYKECCLGESTGNVTFSGAQSGRSARHSDPDDDVINANDDPDAGDPEEDFQTGAQKGPTAEEEEGEKEREGDVVEEGEGRIVGEEKEEEDEDEDLPLPEKGEFDTSSGNGGAEDGDIGAEEEEEVGDETKDEEETERDVVDEFPEEAGNGGDEEIDDEEKVAGKEEEEEVEDRIDEEEDVDECALYAGEVCSHLCVNTARGFYCSCPIGMIIDRRDNRTCILEDGMEDQTCELSNPCEQRCIDKQGGGIECGCWSGYRLAGDLISCEDVDECAEGEASCAPNQRCINTRGRYTCMSARCPVGYELNPHTGRCQHSSHNDCSPGFAFNTINGRCEDVNECGLGIDHCGIGERCENTIGSYACRRIRHCGTGYTLDEESQQCIDNDECILGTHNCDPKGYECKNIPGSFRCVAKSCPTGYRFDTSEGDCVLIDCPVGHRANYNGNCEDIDECVEYGPTTCRRHQECVNTQGSYYCRNTVNCPAGYEPTENGGCQDVNECEAGTHMCGAEQQCVNRQGSYFCQCPRGLRHDHVGRCIDVDECSYGASICPTNSKCVNTLGSFTCDCVDGLVSDGNDSCTDVDECATENVCQQSCVNVLGTFFCSCNRGYQLRDDKRSCQDIDECTQFGGRPGRSGVCAGRCVNTAGSYRCECPAGWRLKSDGRSCQDINECKEGTAYCPRQDSVCINTRGGYKCPVVTCPEGFLRTNSSRQPNSLRCKRVSVDCPECRRGLISRTYNFLSFASNVLVPAPLFSMTGSRILNKFYTWNLELDNARPLRAGIPEASMADFRLTKNRDFARVTLLNRIVGPQDVTLELTMNVTSYYKGFEGTAESKIYLYITEEDNNI